MRTLDDLKMLAAGDLSGHLDSLLEIFESEQQEKAKAKGELLAFVVDRLETSAGADAGACIEILGQMSNRGCLRARYHLAIATLAFGDAGKDAAVAFDLLERVIASDGAPEDEEVVRLALGNSGAMLAVGIGCVQDQQKALERMLEASRRGCLEACFNAAMLMDPEAGQAACTDALMAVQLYRKAAAGGSVPAAAVLAWKILQQTLNEDFEGEGRHWLDMAALGGHPAAVVMSALTAGAMGAQHQHPGMVH